MPNILITGGHGFIGSNLFRLLSEKGNNVLTPNHQELDVIDIDQLHSFVKNNRIDVIIHTATSGKSANITYEQFCNNIQMFENIQSVIQNTPIRIIVIGSGAEFDRRYHIDNINEDLLWRRWPIDLYGLSKNIIARRTLIETDNGAVFRLFGCFGANELSERFIKRSISRIREGLPIKITYDRRMDFLYVDDLALLIDRYIKEGCDSHINAVYSEKLRLSDISRIIMNIMNEKVDIVYEPDDSFATDYTGDGTTLENMRLPLVGLREGIRRML